ncbi:MAG TPA: PLDc N-terminal domain-containing protein [Chitinophagaceae bacterium]|nr:PLDc N-terminal domain-containing protein [Chitinophagaceae bacterium]
MFFLQLTLEGLPLIALLLAFIIWAVGLVVIANSRFHDNTTKLCWFLIILFLNIIGVLLFVFWGRKEIAGSERK